MLLGRRWNPFSTYFNIFHRTTPMNGMNLLRISSLWEDITDAFFGIVYIFYAQVRGKKSINKYVCVCVSKSEHLFGTNRNRQHNQKGGWTGVCLKRIPCK